MANKALEELGMGVRVSPEDITVIAVDQSPYGKADSETLDAIRLLAKTEGLIADPVYERKAVRGLLSLAQEGYFEAVSKILLRHLGGSPAIHAYANQFGLPDLKPFPS
jgi:1-aminocyclopropane-1-carboxylate deaminase